MAQKHPSGPKCSTGQPQPAGANEEMAWGNMAACEADDEEGEEESEDEDTEEELAYGGEEGHEDDLSEELEDHQWQPTQNANQPSATNHANAQQTQPA